MIYVPIPNPQPICFHPKQFSYAPLSTFSCVGSVSADMSRSKRSWMCHTFLLPFIPYNYVGYSLSFDP